MRRTEARGRPGPSPANASAMSSARPVWSDWRRPGKGGRDAQVDRRRVHEPRRSRAGTRRSGRDSSGGFGHGGWHMRYVEDETVREWVLGGIVEAGGFLLGQRTFGIFAAYWPTAPDDAQAIAEPLNTKPKYVASTTLTEPLEWRNSTFLKGELDEAVAALKQEDGGPPRDRQHAARAGADRARPLRRAPGDDRSSHPGRRQALLPRGRRTQAAASRRRTRDRHRGDPRDLRSSSIAVSAQPSTCAGSSRGPRRVGSRGPARPRAPRAAPPPRHRAAARARRARSPSRRPRSSPAGPGPRLATSTCARPRRAHGSRPHAASPEGAYQRRSSPRPPCLEPSLRTARRSQALSARRGTWSSRLRSR